MRKYGYGYVHSKNLVQDPFVRDLIEESRRARREVGTWKQRHKHVETKSTSLHKKIQSLKEEIKYLEKKLETAETLECYEDSYFPDYVLIKKEKLNSLSESELKKLIKKQPRKS